MTHPLFPVDDEDDDVEVGFINVARLEGGRAVFATRQFSGDELTDLEVIWDLYGGGDYELIARDRGNKHITARRRYSLDGPKRPMTGEPVQPVAVAQPVHHHAPADGTAAVLPMMMQFMQMMAQSSQQQAQQTTQILLAVLERGNSSGREHIASMQALHDRFAQSQSELMRAMIESKQSTDPSELFLKGVEYAQGIVEGNGAAIAEAAGNGEDIGSTIRDMFQGVAVMNSLAKQQPNGQSAQPQQGPAEQ